MVIYLYLFVLMICLGTTAGALLIGFQLRKMYRPPFLSTLFYYLIFAMVFGLYGIWGRIFSNYLLTSLGSEHAVIVTIGHFIPFMGIPFMFMAWYQLLRLGYEIMDRKMTRLMSLIYIITFTLLFLLYGYAINQLDNWEGSFLNFDRVVSLCFSVFDLLMLLLFASIQFISRKSMNKNSALIARFTIILAGLTILKDASLLYASHNHFISLAFVLLFFIQYGFIAIYFKWVLDRGKWFIISEDNKTVNGVEQFYLENNITIREREIIEQISLGKTNKEIAEVLFITLQTVKDHTHRIYSKTGVKNRTQLVNLVREKSPLGTSQ